MRLTTFGNPAFPGSGPVTFRPYVTAGLALSCNAISSSYSPLLDHFQPSIFVGKDAPGRRGKRLQTQRSFPPTTEPTMPGWSDAPTRCPDHLGRRCGLSGHRRGLTAVSRIRPPGSPHWSKPVRSRGWQTAPPLPHHSRRHRSTALPNCCRRSGSRWRRRRW